MSRAAGARSHGRWPRIILILLIIGASSCAKKSTDESVRPGDTSLANLPGLLGEPTHIWVPAARPQAKLLDYADGRSVQVERDQVVSVSRPPEAHERTLQYWRHRWAGETPRYEALPGTENIHGQRHYQLASREAGMAVIYDEETDSVIRVVRYERR